MVHASIIIAGVLFLCGGIGVAIYFGLKRSGSKSKPGAQKDLTDEAPKPPSQGAGGGAANEIQRGLLEFNRYRQERDKAKRQASNIHAQAWLTANGEIRAQGRSSLGGSGAPTGKGFVQIVASATAFAALDLDGRIRAWGGRAGGSGAPTSAGFTQIVSNEDGFAALDPDGKIWGWPHSESAPKGEGFVQITSTKYVFAALGGGEISVWSLPCPDTDTLCSEKNNIYGGSGAPTRGGFTQIASTQSAFAALNGGGEISVWGFDEFLDVSGAPVAGGFVEIISTQTQEFAAINKAGEISTWGSVHPQEDIDMFQRRERREGELFLLSVDPQGNTAGPTPINP